MGWKGKLCVRCGERAAKRAGKLCDRCYRERGWSKGEESDDCVDLSDGTWSEPTTVCVVPDGAEPLIVRVIRAALDEASRSGASDGEVVVLIRRLVGG